MMYSKQCSETMQRHATYSAVTKFPVIRSRLAQQRNPRRGSVEVAFLGQVWAHTLHEKLIL